MGAQSPANSIRTPSTTVIHVQIIDPNGGVPGVHYSHQKVIGFHESIGHSSTNGDIIVERAMGKKTGINTGAFTLLEEAEFVQPSGNTQMYVQSTDAEDYTIGSGIQLITIEYFSSDWGDRKKVNVIPNGTNQVTISVADIYRIHKVYGAEGNPAAGLITITNQAESILYGQISQYHAFMQRCIFYVANNRVITCTELSLGTYTKEGIIARVFATEEDEDGNTLTRARMIFELVEGEIIHPFKISESVSNVNNKRMSIGIAVAGVAAAQTATGTLKGFNGLI